MLVSNAAYQRRKESLDDLSDEELELTFDTKCSRTCGSRAPRCAT